MKGKIILRSEEKAQISEQLSSFFLHPVLIYNVHMTPRINEDLLHVLWLMTVETDGVRKKMYINILNITFPFITRSHIPLLRPFGVDRLKIGFNSNLLILHVGNLPAVVFFRFRKNLKPANRSSYDYKSYCVLIRNSIVFY